MTSEAYLTIDDSPCVHTHDLLDAFKARELHALFFCRGDFLEADPQPMIRAVGEGHILANHLYSHQSIGEAGLSFDEIIEEITRTETLIDKVYRSAGEEKPFQALRFPYLDRGDGTRLERVYHELISGERTTLPGDDLVRRIQEWLKAEGYEQPFEQITHPLYELKDIARARDSLLTYTSNDWMLTPRHIGREAHKSLNDLKEKIDNDPFLTLEGSRHIVLFHDDREGIAETVAALLDHMITCGVKFLTY